MHRVPVGRKFGGPEIALIAVALAFAVPLTAWWHGLYQQPERTRVHAANVALPLQALALPAGGGGVSAVAGVGYVFDVNPANNAIALPLSTPGTLAAPAQTTPVADPNQVLLLVVALMGMAAAGVYSMGVYPALRR
ncbi:MAG: hypothetical protein FJY92_12855 [Candidatus Hydrogenedentes bacterium]|nr:hypothetical protein [Candidatus Hydrogenedentota bacterium]